MAHPDPGGPGVGAFDAVEEVFGVAAVGLLRGHMEVLASVSVVAVAFLLKVDAGFCFIIFRDVGFLPDLVIVVGECALDESTITQ